MEGVTIVATTPKEVTVGCLKPRDIPSVVWEDKGIVDRGVGGASYLLRQGTEGLQGGTRLLPQGDKLSSDMIRLYTE